MLGLRQVHHTVIIATDHMTSKVFYYDVLGFILMSEAYRKERDSWKDDPVLNGQYVTELFSFPFPPCRPSRPETCGLRHLAFSTEDVEKSITHLEAHHTKCEFIHASPFTDKRFTLFNDPDGLPLGLYEV